MRRKWIERVSTLRLGIWHQVKSILAARKRRRQRKKTTDGMAVCVLGRRAIRASQCPYRAEYCAGGCKVEEPLGQLLANLKVEQSISINCQTVKLRVKAEMSNKHSNRQ